MEPAQLHSRLDQLDQLNSIQRAGEIIKITEDFFSMDKNFSWGKTEAKERLKKEIHIIRMELAFNKATESNTGNLDKKIGRIIKAGGPVETQDFVSLLLLIFY